MKYITQEKLDHPNSSKAFDVHNIPLPEKFSRRVSGAIHHAQLVAENRALFVRECVSFYEATLPRPTEQQYNVICQKLCDQYPSLKDKKTAVYWVGATKPFLRMLQLLNHDMRYDSLLSVSVILLFLSVKKD